MRNVHVYAGKTVIMDGVEVKKVIAINTPTHNSLASIELGIDGEIHYHPEAYEAVAEVQQVTHEENYRRLRERVTNAMQTGKIDQALYDKLTRHLPQL